MNISTHAGRQLRFHLRVLHIDLICVTIMLYVEAQYLISRRGTCCEMYLRKIEPGIRIGSIFPQPLAPLS